MEAPSVATRRAQRAGMIPAADEADELQHHDERPGRRLRQTQSIHHLRRREPAVVLDCLLPDIRQHRVSSAKGHHRGLAEETPSPPARRSSPASRRKKNRCPPQRERKPAPWPPRPRRLRVQGDSGVVNHCALVSEPWPALTKLLRERKNRPPRNPTSPAPRR